MKKINEGLSRRDFLKTAGSIFPVMMLDGCLWRAIAPAQTGLDVELDLFGQCHIDLLWQWIWRETQEITQSTFKNMLRLIQQMPQFAFYQNQAALYAAMEAYDPALFEQIRAAVRNGRWHIVGGNWAETDQGLCTGESVVRNYLLGKRYFREKFGIDVKAAWQMEGSAYLNTLPQVLRGCGFAGAIIGRQDPWGTWWRPAFRWRGTDGSEIPVVALRHYFLRPDELPRWLREAVQINQQWQPYRFAFVYGGGDHGGGPDVRLLQALGVQLQQLGISQWHSTRPPVEFFRDLESNELPAIAGHLHIAPYGRFSHTGLQTQHRVKRLNRECEHLLLSVEVLSSLTHALLPEEPVPKLTEAWQGLIFCQFHDIIWGSTSYQPYTEALARLERVREESRATLEQAAQRLLSAVNTQGEGVPLVICNALPWPRHEVVALQVPRSSIPSAEPALTVVDPAGQVAPVQLVPTERSDEVQMLLPVEIIPCGYRTFWLRSGQAESDLRTSSTDDAILLENKLLKVEVDRRTGWLRWVERAGRAFVAPEGFRLRAYRDVGSAWGSKLQGILWEEGQARSVRLGETGPVRAGVVIEVESPQGSRLIKEVRLYTGIPIIELVVRGDWQWARTQLAARFPILAATQLVTEIPFGFTNWIEFIGRTVTQGEVWEVPQLRWAWLGDEQGGLAILNEGKHAVLFDGAALMLPLLRTPPFVEQDKWVIYRQPPDVPQFNDLGPFEVRFALLPLESSWRDAARWGMTFNVPLEGWLAPTQAGPLPVEFSFFQLEPASVLVSALKPSEDGNNLILRVYEACGQATQVRLRFGRVVGRIVETNLLEEPIVLIAEQVQELPLPLGAHQIRTLRLEL